MKSRSLSFFALLGAAAAVCLLAAGAAHAQLPKIFVASFGNDANDGSRLAPKRNFQSAHDAVADGGQIVVLDTAGYGALFITKSLSVTVPSGVNGFVTVGGTSSGITISAGASSVVALRGLIIEGGGTSNGNGIGVFSVGTLTIAACTVRHFQEGILVSPTAAAQVSISNTAVRGCRNGLDVQNNAVASVIVSAIRCRLEANSNAGAQAFIFTAGGSVDLTLEGCAVRGNPFGITAQDANAPVRVSNCTIVGNTFGTNVQSNGQILSRGNNTLEKNTGGNTFPGAYAAK